MSIIEAGIRPEQSKTSLEIVIFKLKTNRSVTITSADGEIGVTGYCKRDALYVWGVVTGNQALQRENNLFPKSKPEIRDLDPQYYDVD